MTRTSDVVEPKEREIAHVMPCLSKQKKICFLHIINMSLTLKTNRSPMKIALNYGYYVSILSALH